MKRLFKRLGYIFNKLFFYRSQEHIEFSFVWFSSCVVVQTAIWFLLIYYPLQVLWPSFWVRQLEASRISYVLCFLVAHLGMAFFEFFFHRYVLHSTFLKALHVLARKHGKHHQLTPVRERKHEQPQSDGRVTVLNRYPIVAPLQVESSTFPGYALLAFWGIFTPAILAAQILLPGLPIVLTGYLSVAWSVWLYETKHAVEHLDYDKYWKPWVEKNRFVRRIYGFHLLHHSRVKVNEAIGGFFGFLPLPDLVFGTYFVPDQLPLPGVTVDPATQEPHPPCWLIRWLDKIAARRNQKIVDAKIVQARYGAR